MVVQVKERSRRHCQQSAVSEDTATIWHAGISAALHHQQTHFCASSSRTPPSFFLIERLPPYGPNQADGSQQHRGEGAP